MTAILEVYPDVEAAVMQRLTGMTATVPHERIPTNLSTLMPILVVRRYGGSDDGLTDRATVEVQAFAATRAAVRTLAAQVQQRIIAAPYSVTVGSELVLVDYAETIESPHEVDWGDSSVRRYVASYTLGCRR